MTSDYCQAAFSIVNQMHALVAYWNADERCTFSNQAYQSWFGKTPAQMESITLRELLGPSTYARNRPHIRGALRGEKQIFECLLTRSASGVTQRFLATYSPDPEGDAVRGFSVHATELPAELSTQNLLHEWLSICSSCKDIRTATGEWHPLEDYFALHSSITFTHGLCPKCIPRYFPSSDNIVTSI